MESEGRAERPSAALRTRKSAARRRRPRCDPGARDRALQCGDLWTVTRRLNQSSPSISAEKRAGRIPVPKSRRTRPLANRSDNGPDDAPRNLPENRVAMYNRICVERRETDFFWTFVYICVVCNIYYVQHTHACTHARTHTRTHTHTHIHNTSSPLEVHARTRARAHTHTLNIYIKAGSEAGPGPGCSGRPAAAAPPAAPAAARRRRRGGGGDGERKGRVMCCQL